MEEFEILSKVERPTNGKQWTISMKTNSRTVIHFIISLLETLYKELELESTIEITHEGSVVEILKFEQSNGRI